MINAMGTNILIQPQRFMGGNISTRILNCFAKFLQFFLSDKLALQNNRWILKVNPDLMR